MYSFIFDILTDPLGLPIDALWEYVILLIIGIIAFTVGWEVSPGGVFGSLIHWVARLFAFFALWAITYFVIAAAKWIIGHLVLVLGISAAAIIAIAVVFAIRRRGQDICC